jgi:hypothetical protein
MRYLRICVGMMRLRSSVAAMGGTPVRMTTPSQKVLNFLSLQACAEALRVMNDSESDDIGYGFKTKHSITPDRVKRWISGTHHEDYGPPLGFVFHDARYH